MPKSKRSETTEKESLFLSSNTNSDSSPSSKKVKREKKTKRQPKQSEKDNKETKEIIVIDDEVELCNQPHEIISTDNANYELIRTIHNMSTTDEHQLENIEGHEMQTSFNAAKYTTQSDDQQHLNKT